MSDQLAAHGVAVSVPPGWEAEVSTVTDGAEASGGLSLAAAAPRVLLHLANFALPPTRGDYGSGAVEIMDRGGILIVLMEFDRAAAGSELFAHDGIPAALAPVDFSADALQRRLPGQAGVQRFFHVGGRAFGIYVVIGSGAIAGVLVPEVNRLLAGLTID